MTNRARRASNVANMARRASNYYLTPASCTLHPASCILLPASCTLLPASGTPRRVEPRGPFLRGAVRCAGLVRVPGLAGWGWVPLVMPKGHDQGGTPPPPCQARYTYEHRTPHRPAQERASGLNGARRVRVQAEPGRFAPWRYCIFGRSRPVRQNGLRPFWRMIG